MYVLETNLGPSDWAIEPFVVHLNHSWLDGPVQSDRIGHRLKTDSKRSIVTVKNDGVVVVKPAAFSL